MVKRQVRSATKMLEAPGHAGACGKITKKGAVPFADAMAILRAWRRRYPDAVQLDGHPSGRNNLKPWFHFKLTGFSSPAHDFLTKHSQEQLLGRHYNGVWNLHGDAKAEAVDGLLALFAANNDPLTFLKQTATHETKAEHTGDQNPKLTLDPASGVKDLYFYLG